MRTSLLALTALFAGSSFAGETVSLPLLPYESVGACPFECCTYRDWPVQKDTDILAERLDGSKIIFRAKAGTKVSGITGVVITTKFGRAKFEKASKLGSVSFPAGASLPVVRYSGEGEWRVLMDGKEGSAFLPNAADCRNPRRNKRLDCSVQLEIRPETTWWVKVRTESGLEGWSRETKNFGGKDSCGA